MAKRESKRDDSESSPPGDFISEDLRVQTARFLDELKKRLGRSKAEQGPKFGPPKRPR
jgi:hypothetical protein